MSLSKHMRHYQRCISLTRQLSTSRDGDASTISEKLSGSLNIIQKSTKMSLPSQWKFLAQIKDFLNKSGYEKNVQFVINKDWIDFFHRLTYSQIESIRKISSHDNSKPGSIDENRKNFDSTRKSVAISLPQEERNIVEELKQDLKQEVKQTVDTSATIPPEKYLKDQIYSFPQVLAALMPKFGVAGKAKTFPIIPKWKKNLHINVSKHSILSRTKHVLNSIATAESNASRWRRIEDLLAHIDQYPEARYHAIKEGGVSLLLRIRRRTNDEQIQASLREALAVLGHSDPLPGRGIRILAIDGGGIRGVLVIEMLKKLEQLTGKRVYEMFDYVCGVSTGAILSAVIGNSVRQLFNEFGLRFRAMYPKLKNCRLNHFHAATIKDNGEGSHKRKSLDEVSELYKDLSTKIFTQSPLKGTSSLVWSHAYYDTALWEEMLQEQLGDKDLIKTVRDTNTPKFSAVSAVVNHERVMAYIFRNYTLPHGVESQYMGSYKHKLWEAVRASAAAPSYFEEFRRGEFLHQDGGILVNNPCAVAIHEAKQLWPNSPIQCVVSFGTGRTPFFMNQNEGEERGTVIASSWRDKFYKILDSATDTEAVHIMLNDLLPDYVYYRFNPYLTEMLTMVEIRPDKIAQLEQDARMYIRRNEDKFQHAAKALLEKRQITQQIGDWVRMQKTLLGT